MKRSPARIVELCIYILIIIAAVIWLVTKGSIYSPPDIPPPPTPAVTQSAPLNTPPPVIVPKGEVFPGK